MPASLRSQADDLFDIYSLEHSLDCAIEGNVDVARQELKDETDINLMLKKFGVFAPSRSVAQWGIEIDYNMDLQQALEAVTAAKRAWGQMTPELKAAYPTWQSLLNGLDSGEFKLDLNEPPPPPPPPPIEAEG